MRLRFAWLILLASCAYTILVHSNSFTVVPATYTKLGFDPVHDFIGVMPIASLPMA